MKSKSVTLKSVGKSFVDDKGKVSQAVHNVNLDIAAGEFVTLLGPSGCGKTTTLRMIAGFEAVTEGDIYFGTENVRDTLPSKRDCTMVFQSYALFPHMSVFENVAYGLRIKKIPNAQIEEKITKIFTLMNLSDYRERMPGQLSGGQQQRVALARALVMEPGVLLFDEPLSNLDAKLRLIMRDEIRRMQKEAGITAIYVTHDQSEAMSMSDKIVVMNKGQIEQVGTPVEIYQRPTTEFVANFIGVANFLKGKVIAQDTTAMTIEMPLGSFKVKPNPNVTLNSVVTLVARPEGVSLAGREVAINGNVLQGKILKSVFMGQVQEYMVQAGEQVFQVNDSNPLVHQIYQAGDAVQLVFEPNSLHLIG